MANEDKIVAFDDISKHYGGIYALKNVNFDLTNEIHSIVGHNGAGKSTLVKILMGAVQPDHGVILRNGNTVSFSSPREALENGIAMVWQELANFPNLTITENILMHRFIYNKFNHIDWNKSHDMAEIYLERINIKISPTTIMSKLSLAQQQLIEFAKALSYDPEILILDEPTSALSYTEQQIVYDKVRMIKSQNVAVVFISHKLDEILDLSDRISVLRDGNKIFTKTRADLDKEQIIEAIVGNNSERKKGGGRKIEPRLNPKRPGKPILQINGLSSERKLENITFNLHQGEILGIVGVSGSGISDIGKVIFGMEHEYSGEISLNGKAYKCRSPNQAVEDGFGYVPKNRKEEGIIPQLTVGENIVLSMLRQITFGGIVDRKKQKTIIKKIINKIDLIPGNPEIQIEMLSGGNQQKGVIARWISNKTRILILDEPTRGVDVGAIVKIYSLISLMAKEGLSVIIISSEFNEVHEIADRIIVLNRGKIAGEINPERQSWENAFALSIK